MYGSNYGRVTEVSIVELRLQETGTFNNQYHRPFEAIIRHESLENLSRRIESTISAAGPSRIDNSLISGMSDGLITVSATPDQETAIANGWHERRFRFTMTVAIKSGFGERLCYFQGYSEFFDVSHGNNIDPNMVFYINSYTVVSRMADPTNPMNGYIDRVIESRQVLNGTYGANNSPQLYGIRPEDLFIGVQSSYFSQGNLDSSIPIRDTRIGLSGQTFASNRVNAIPSNLLTTVVNTWREVETTADFGQGGESIHDRAIQKLHDRSPLENPFIAQLSQLQYAGLTPTTHFTLADLAKIDPTVSQRIYYQPLEDFGQVHSVGMTSQWNGADKLTQIAYLAATSTIALMQATGMITAHFFATNMTMDGTPVVNMTAPGVTFSTTNPTGAYNLFTMRFTSEVMPDITCNNLIPVSVSISADIYNETMITISMDGQPAVDYVFPSFADSLLQPMMTVSSHNYNDMITGVESILNYCGISSPSMAGQIAQI